MFETYIAKVYAAQLSTYSGEKLEVIKSEADGPGATIESRIVDPKTAIAWRPAPNDEAMTVNRVREYLRVDPNHRHPITGKLGAPRVYFLMKTEDYPRGIHETIVDLRSQRRVEAGTGPNGEKLFGDERASFDLLPPGAAQFHLQLL